VSFSTFADFVAMGGHALYVWTSYALGAVVIGASIIGPVRARRRFFAVEAERLKRADSSRRVAGSEGSEDASGST
jgi:heme exporter protein D